MKRRAFCTGVALTVLAAPLPAIAGEVVHATLYKNPQCTCCEGYAAYLRKNGFDVDVKPTNDLAEISRKAGVPEQFQGCHTMFVDGYVVDGHVPVDVVRKLLYQILGADAKARPDRASRQLVAHGGHCFGRCRRAPANAEPDREQRRWCHHSAATATELVS